jgi:Leucine-rich repeat (LRR) protein
MPNLQPYVQGIDFSFNQISFIEEKAFNNFTALRKLRFNQNWITIDKSTDGWITHELGRTLEELYLPYNMITKLDYPVFDPLEKLKRLVLDGNPDLGLTSNTFGVELKQLSTLSLDNCKISSLPNDVFSKLP